MSVCDGVFLCIYFSYIVWPQRVCMRERAREGESTKSELHMCTCVRMWMFFLFVYSYPCVCVSASEWVCHCMTVSRPISAYACTHASACKCKRECVYACVAEWVYVRLFTSCNANRCQIQSFSHCRRYYHFRVIGMNLIYESLCADV